MYKVKDVLINKGTKYKNGMFIVIGIFDIVEIANKIYIFSSEYYIKEFNYHFNLLLLKTKKT